MLVLVYTSGYIIIQNDNIIYIYMLNLIKSL